MIDKTEALDDLETLLLFAMEAPENTDTKWRRTGRDVFSRSAIDQYRFDDRTPQSAYTFDLMDEGRIFTLDHNDLLAHPSEIIGDGAECMIVDHNNNLVKWSRIEPCRKPARGFAPIGKADKWYAVHMRNGDPQNGWTDYIKGYNAIAKDGKQIPIKWMNANRFDAYDLQRNADQIIMMCSIIEDAHRFGAFLASTRVTSEILFPVGYDSYRDFFSLRDAPRNTPSGKRNPILHWVTSHIRKTQSGKEAHVKQHLRGVADVEIDGIKARITPNTR